MRRRLSETSVSDPMDKGTGKNQHSRICLLATLALTFCFLLFYFNFIVLGGGTTSANIIPVHSRKIFAQPPVISAPVIASLPPAVSIPHAPNVSDSFNLIIIQSNNGQQMPVNHPAVDIPPEPAVLNYSISNSNSTDSNAQPTMNILPEQNNFPFMRALRTAENKSDPCGGRYIYVHDLPSRFNEDMIKGCRTLSLWTNMCKFTGNDGLGRPLKNVEGVFSNTGWYDTNQFAVDVIFADRMKQYECLTNDSSLAAAFFVPFYAGFDIARYLWGYNTSMRDGESLDLVDWLVKRPEWRIMGGKDHFLVGGRITWDFMRLSDEETEWGNKLLCLPAAKNMSMLVVESSPWNANDFAIPYPTYLLRQTAHNRARRNEEGSLVHLVTRQKKAIQ